jgi:RND family efflux transporter MFP subunit
MRIEQMHILKSLIAYRFQKKLFVACSLLSIGLLVGCSEDAPPQFGDVARPVKTMVIAGADASGMRSFPARIAAAVRAELAFRVAGTVKDLPVKERDRLQEGDLVARLDSTDYQFAVDDKRATFENVAKNYERAKTLVKSGAIAQADVDKLESNFKSARAALNTATKDLEYTELKAPFDGIIATREVERFEEIRAKQTIVVLHNIDMLEVQFDAPESFIRSIRSSSAEKGMRPSDSIPVFASFEGQNQTRHPLTFKEISTSADAKTQTFEMTYLMKQLGQGAGSILPGMTASVTMDVSDYIDREIVFTVPISAVVGDYKLEPQVWKVDEDSMSVSVHPVKVGRLVGNNIEVLEGLEPGDLIVTAGTPFLVEDMQVTLLAELEQAEPRPEDLESQQ